MPGIFISHTAGDKPIADAFTVLIEALFGEHVSVDYSSKKKVEGGIRPGEDWFRWIVDQVRKTDVAMILLTPVSIQKPWVLWEAGAVAGAAYATVAEKARVYPARFGIKPSDVPTPFANIQTINGTDVEDVLKLVTDLQERFADGMTRKDFVRFGQNQEAASRKFVADVGAALLTLPHVITEATIQEWLMRLDELKESARFSEARVIENWLDVAFGREDEDRQRPLDVRIHRRLGDLYAAAGQAGDAARQFDLARRLSPRDIYILRRLGKAHLDQKNRELAGQVIGAIKAIAPEAFETNAENAALYARWCEASDNLAGARDVLEKAYANLPDAYYLGDRLGQILVRMNNRERAREIFGQVVRKVRSLQEHNVWTVATLLTAALVQDDLGAQADSLARLRQMRPSREQLDSIERGVREMVSASAVQSNVLQELRSIAG